MATYILEEVYIFLATLYGGIVIGFIYDLYRIFRLILRPKKIATFIEDFIFWMVISVAALWVLIFSNDGQLRFYNFLGFILGALLYNKMLSKFVIRNMVWILRGIRKIFKFIGRILLMPVRALMNILYIPYKSIKKRMKPLYYRIRGLSRLPRRQYQEMIKYFHLLRKKK